MTGSLSSTLLPSPHYYTTAPPHHHTTTPPHYLVSSRLLHIARGEIAPQFVVQLSLIVMLSFMLSWVIVV